MVCEDSGRHRGLRRTSSRRRRSGDAITMRDANPFAQGIGSWDHAPPASLTGLKYIFDRIDLCANSSAISTLNDLEMGEHEG